MKVCAVTLDLVHNLPLCSVKQNTHLINYTADLLWKIEMKS